MLRPARAVLPAKPAGAEGGSVIPKGPYVVWENFGYEGWQPKNFATLDEAVRYRSFSECAVTRLVDFQVIDLTAKDGS